MIKLVLFDLDDTLFLNERAFWETENGIAKDLGLSPVAPEAHRLNWGKPTKERLTDNFGAADASRFMNKLLEFFPELIGNGKIDVISDKNTETLKILKTNGKHLAVLTARSAIEVGHLLEENNQLGKLVEHVYHAGNSEYVKPDIKVFDRILTDFGVKPSETVYVGDLVSDAECAKKAGLHFIAILENGLRTAEDFGSQPVDFFANTLPEIVDYILLN